MGAERADEAAEVVTPDELATSLEREPKRAEPDAPDGQFDSQNMPTTDGEMLDADGSE